MNIEGVSDFLLLLLDRGSVQIDTGAGGGFKHRRHQDIPGAPLSPIKFHLCTQRVRKEGRLTDEDIHALGGFLYEYIDKKKLKFDGIAGIPSAGEPIAQALQDCCRIYGNTFIPLVPLIKTTGEDGTRHITGVKDVPGLPAQDSLILLVDDLINGGDTKAEASLVLQSAGYRVHDCLVFLDYENGGKELLWNKAETVLHAVTRVRHAVNLYRDSELITSETHDLIMQSLQP